MCVDWWQRNVFVAQARTVCQSAMDGFLKNVVHRGSCQKMRSVFNGEPLVSCCLKGRTPTTLDFLHSGFVSDPGGAGIPSLSGECKPRKECAGTQVGCFRLSMAAISTFGRFTARVVPAGTGGLYGAFDPPTSGQPGADGFESRPTHAKGFGSDEPATAPRDQRYHRCNWNDDHEGPLGG
jgi:hypothetical protein